MNPVPFEHFADPFRPFHHHRARFERRVDLQPRPFPRLETEGVEMIQHFAVGAFVFVHQDERRAARRPGGAPSAGHALHQGGLAGAQIPVQANQVTGAQDLPQPGAHPLGLLRAARGEIDRVGVEDGHGLII